MDEKIGTRAIDTITVELTREQADEVTKVLNSYIAAVDPERYGDPPRYFHVLRDVREKIAEKLAQ